MFDILHYLSNLICYCDEVGKYSMELSDLSLYATIILEYSHYSYESSDETDEEFYEYKANHHLKGSIIYEKSDSTDEDHFIDSDSE